MNGVGASVSALVPCRKVEASVSGGRFMRSRKLAEFKRKMPFQRGLERHLSLVFRFALLTGFSVLCGKLANRLHRLSGATDAAVSSAAHSPYSSASDVSSSMRIAAFSAFATCSRAAAPAPSASRAFNALTSLSISRRLAGNRSGCIGEAARNKLTREYRLLTLSFTNALPQLSSQME